MKKLPITLVPQPVLKEKARKVSDFGPALGELVEKMTQVMRDHDGIGLAAPQVGVSQQVILVEYEPDERGGKSIPLTALVNPTITSVSKQTDWMDEGCLSIPDVLIPVERPVEVTVLAEDLSGKRFKVRAKDLHARVLQHEIDHLQGTLITDRAYPQLKELAGLRVVFMGTPLHAVPYLTALAATDVNIVGVVTETDKPVGRKQVLTAPPVKDRAKALGLPIFQFESLKDKTAQQQLAALKPDLIIVVAYGKIIPQAILDLPKHGCLNVHYSLLPALRGPSPHQTAIWQGLKETGFTIFRLEAGVDTGPIMAQRKMPIDPEDTSESLIAKMIVASLDTLFQTLPDYISGKIKLRPQDHAQATHTRLLEKEDGRIDWTQSATQIEAQIRAMQPWPVAFTEVEGQRLLIHEAHLYNDQLIIDVVQPAGKQPMRFNDYLRGNRDNRLTFFRQTGKVKID